MVPFIVMLGNEIYNIKMISLKHIIKSNARKVMTKFGFGRRFHNHKYFEVDFSFIFF